MKSAVLATEEGVLRHKATGHEETVDHRNRINISVPIHFVFFTRDAAP